MQPHEAFLVVLAIEPILLSALPLDHTSAPFAAITSWCSFRQTNVSFGRETWPVHQVLGMIWTLSNSSKVKLQFHSCKISHRCNQWNNGRTSAALQRCSCCRQVPADSQSAPSGADASALKSSSRHTPLPFTSKTLAFREGVWLSYSGWFLPVQEPQTMHPAQSIALRNPRFNLHTCNQVSTTAIWFTLTSVVSEGRWLC